MHITQIPGELGRFIVDSESRPDVAFVVDLMYQETPQNTPRPACGCEDYMGKNHNPICKHIVGCVAYALTLLARETVAAPCTERVSEPAGDL